MHIKNFNVKNAGRSVTRANDAHDARTPGGDFDSFFSGITNNVKSEYDMWAWIFQEIATLRIEVSRLGSLVRLNNPQSPSYIEAYHAQLYALLIPIRPVIPSHVWNKIEKLWLDTKNEIDNYFKKRHIAPNKKIPFELIKQLDKLYLIAVIVIQKGGLGFRTTKSEDMDAALEAAIAGD